MSKRVSYLIETNEEEIRLRMTGVPVAEVIDRRVLFSARHIKIFCGAALILRIMDGS